MNDVNENPKKKTQKAALMPSRETEEDKTSVVSEKRDLKWLSLFGAQPARMTPRNP